MSAVVDAIVSVVSAVWDAIVDLVEAVWDSIAEPILEEIFSWFGIEDETVVEVDKISQKLMGDNVDDTVKAAQVKAVLEFTQSNSRFFPVYMKHISASKAYVRSYYNYAQQGRYTHGLPSMSVKGQLISFNDVKIAVDTEFFGGVDTAVVTFADQAFPTFTQYYHNWLQQAPYNYHPGNQTLTYPDQWGIDRLWDLDDIVDNVTDYTIEFSRSANRVEFWIYGPSTVPEGDTAQYTIYASETVPVGKSITINLAYGGSASDGVDFSSVASVVMPAGADSVQLNLNTIENTDPHTARDIVVTLDSLDNTADAFDDPRIWAPKSSVTTNITDDEGVILTMPHPFVGENDTTVTIPVKLEDDAAGAFTVDYDFTDITATGIIGGGAGSDYDSTPGTLNFAGTAGEIQNIIIPITPDVANDDLEEFQVNLLNCSDPGVTLTNTKVTIWDGTDDPASSVNTINESFTVPLFADNEELIVHYYDPIEGAGNFKIWHYDISSNIYPSAATKESELTELEMLPIAILRKDKQNITEADPAFKSTKTLLSRLQLTLEDVLENIDSPDNPQPGVDDCYINFSVSPNDNNRIVSKILYLNFYQLHVVHSLNSNNNQYHADFQEQDIQNALAWTDYQWNPDTPGTLPIPVGEYTHTVDKVADPSELRLQYRKSATHYDELIINGINAVAAIEYGGYHQLALKTLGDDALTIPVSNFVFQQLSSVEMLEVYGYILRIDFSAIEITHLEWYETAGFLDLFNFVLVVITVVSLGTASSFTAALYQLAINYVIIELVIFIAELTGNEALAAIIGVVAAFALMDAGNIIDFGSLSTADQILQVTTNFSQNFQAAMGVTSAELRAELEAIEEAYQDRIDEIERFNEENDQLVDINFMVALQSANTNLYKAIQNQYDVYDQVYNSRDRAVTDYIENQTRVGVV